MDDLVERVARAINSTAYAEHEEPWAKDRWPDFLDAARIVTAAVLDAIAEPSEAMLSCVATACSKRPAQDDDSDTAFIYRTMIAALRKEFVPLPKPPSEIP